MSKIQTSQNSEMFGDLDLPLKILESLVENYPETNEDLKNFKKAILNFNALGIEIDISLRYDSIIFQDRA